MTLPDEFFRKLSPGDEKVFREWAREHFEPGGEANPVWHPVVRDEWEKLQKKWEEEHEQGNDR